MSTITLKLASTLKDKLVIRTQEDFIDGEDLSPVLLAVSIVVGGQVPIPTGETARQGYSTKGHGHGGNRRERGWDNNQ